MIYLIKTKIIELSLASISFFLISDSPVYAAAFLTNTFSYSSTPPNNVDGEVENFVWAPGSFEVPGGSNNNVLAGVFNPKEHYVYGFMVVNDLTGNAPIVSFTATNPNQQRIESIGWISDSILDSRTRDIEFLNLLSGVDIAGSFPTPAGSVPGIPDEIEYVFMGAIPPDNIGTVPRRSDVFYFTSPALPTLANGELEGNLPNNPPETTPGRHFAPIKPITSDGQEGASLGTEAPKPIEVLGKEYSDGPDRNAIGEPDELQNLAWTGLGDVTDTFDYNGDVSSGLQVDALANVQDALFFEVISDEVPILLSLENDPNIYYEPPKIRELRLWASQEEINQIGVDDVDGLEVWGPEPTDDANIFSLEEEVSLGVSAFNFDALNNVSSPYILSSDIAAAIGRPDLQVNIDAMMIFDAEGDDAFTPGDFIIFSIDPVDIFIGDEVWVWNGDTENQASFLFHGGHEWSTNWLGEDINALEAVAKQVPEKISNLVYLAFGMLGVVLNLKRRLKLPQSLDKNITKVG